MKTLTVNYRKFMSNLYERNGYRSLYQELQELEKSTVLADTQMDQLWKNISNQATNTYLYVHDLTKKIIKTIDREDVRCGHLDEEEFTKFLTDSILKNLTGERDKSQAFKEKEVMYNIEKIAPTLWEDLVEQVREEEEMIYRFRREDDERRMEERGKREERVSFGWAREDEGEG